MRMSFYSYYKSHIGDIGLLMLDIAEEMNKEEEK
jgi:hypothetical protein